MATSSSSGDPEVVHNPPYPSLEELRRLHNLDTKPYVIERPDGRLETVLLPDIHKHVILPSSAKERILWTLEDKPFPQAISVMQDKNSPDLELAPFLSLDGTWHPISQGPISEPKISSITVHIDEIDRWEYLWKEAHRTHGVLGFAQEGRWYGDLEDYDPTEDSDKEEHLLGCCGQARPRKKKSKIVVQAGSRGFVTLYDYFSTLHPWVMSLKEGIITSNALCDNYLSEMVVLHGLELLMVREKAEWIRRKSHMRNKSKHPHIEHPPMSNTQIK